MARSAAPVVLVFLACMSPPVWGAQIQAPADTHDTLYSPVPLSGAFSGFAAEPRGSSHDLDGTFPLARSMAPSGRGGTPDGIGLAQDLPPPLTSPKSIVQHLAIDGSATATSLGDRSADLNATFAPFGDINESGFRVRLSGSASWYRFVSNENPRTLASGHTVETGVLAGYQLSLPRINFLALIGPTFAESNDDGISSGHVGAKAVLSMYALPTDVTMAWGSITYSTIANFVQVQTKVGMKVVQNFYIGPEASFFWRNVTPSIDNVGVIRLGGHISAVTLGPVQVGVSGGWAQQQGLGTGYYGGMNFYLTF